MTSADECSRVVLLPRTIIEFAVILLFLLPVTEGLAQWTWRNPLPQGNDLYAAWFVNQDKGFVVGDIGTVLKTTNGGLTWTITLLKDVNPYTHLSGICFPDENTGYIINSEEQIYKTTDGGDTWDLIYTETDYYLSAVHFADALHGVVVCTGSRILKTADGGTSWSKIDITPTAYLRSVWFPDAQNGYVVGNNGLILHSADGGNTWLPQNSGVTTALFSVNFSSQANGYAVGDSGVILGTLNSGNTWTPTNVGDTVELYSVSSVNQDTAIAVGRADWSILMMNAPRMFRTVNGGITWSIIPGNNYYKSVFCLPDGTAFTEGYLGLIGKTSDGGSSWTLLSNCLTSNSIRCIDFPTPEIGYAATAGYEVSTGVILKTTDGGDSWFSLDSTFYQKNFHAVDFTSATFGCIAGENIYNTFDGGASWMLRYTGSWYRTVRSLRFASSTVGIAVGDSGTILRTSDIGQTWTRLASGTSNPLNSVCFPDPNTGYIAGTGVLLKTQDAGVTWTLQTMPYYLFGICFTSSLVGFAGGCAINGGPGRIIKTINGGGNWSDITHAGNQSRIRAIHFYDADTGYAVGGISFVTSVVWKTVDGGLNWQELKLPSNYPFYSVTATDTYKVYIGGHAGYLFGTTNGGITGAKEPGLVDNPPMLTAYPNPTSDHITLSFDIVHPSHVSIAIFDCLGNRVGLVTDSDQHHGLFTATYATRGLNAGVYFIRLRVDNHVEMKKVIIMQ